MGLGETAFILHFDGYDGLSVHQIGLLDHDTNFMMHQQDHGPFSAVHEMRLRDIF
jgi:hypothetical protein